MKDIKVIAPMNMGERLVYSDEQKRYNVDVSDLEKRIAQLEQNELPLEIRKFLQRNTMVGVLFPFFGKVIPEGFIVADGRRIDQVTQPILHSIYGDNMPDTRAAFLRGLDDGKGIDKGRVLGSLQKGSGIAYDPNRETVNLTSLIYNHNQDSTGSYRQAYEAAGYDYTDDISAQYRDVSIVGRYSGHEDSTRLYANNQNSFRIGIVRPLNIACRYICLAG